METELRLPVLNESLLYGSSANQALFANQLIEICHQAGCFYLKPCSIPTTLCREVIEKTHDFFALPLAEKSKVHIKLSPHFRGYSEMKNVRDWREQVHFGLERRAIGSELDKSHFHNLQGPNLWVPELGQNWQDTMMSFLDAVDKLSQRLLSSLAWSLGLPRKYFVNLANETPYLLMKLLYYHPQVTNQKSHVGIAPHCDWSWMTFLLQDDVGGLQIRLPNGNWVDVTPVPNTFVINLGELLEILTRGYLRATPHRVVNKSSARPRISVPIFINPALTARINPIQIPDQYQFSSDISCIEYEHIHRVYNPSLPFHSFIFGESEWNRKGKGFWCYNKACYDR